MSRLPQIYCCYLLLLLLGIGSSSAVYGGDRSAFTSARYIGIVGETGNLYLPENSLYIQPMYNDIFGKTDKHLSGKSTIGLVRTFSDSSFEIRTDWYFVTPDIKVDFNEATLQQQPGKFADWAAFDFAYSKIVGIGGQKFKIQSHTSFSHIGDKGARYIHQAIHKAVKNKWENLLYADQPTEGAQLSIGLETGYVWDPINLRGRAFEMLSSVGYVDSPMMNDAFVSHHVRLNISDSVRLALEGRLIAQHRSRFYLNKADSWRGEIAAGALLWKFYRPSVKYVSPFVMGDPIGQLYVDAFNVYWDF